MEDHEADACTCDACNHENGTPVHPVPKYDGKIWCTCKPGTRCEVDCLIENEDFIDEAIGELMNDALGG